ncbi:hypothetical protein D3C78_1174950 [compost metagenome]
MDHIREFDRIANEEYRQVVAYYIIVAFLRIKLHCKAARVTRSFRRASRIDDSREPDKYRRLLSSLLEQMSLRMLRHAVLRTEYAVCACAACMNDALRNAFPVEMRQLLQQMIILQQGRSALACCA